MPNVLIIRVQTSGITRCKQTNTKTNKQTDRQTDNAFYIVDENQMRQAEHRTAKDTKIKIELHIERSMSAVFMIALFQLPFRT